MNFNVFLLLSVFLYLYKIKIYIKNRENFVKIHFNKLFEVQNCWNIATCFENYAFKIMGNTVEAMYFIQDQTKQLQYFNISFKHFCPFLSFVLSSQFELT